MPRRVTGLSRRICHFDRVQIVGALGMRLGGGWNWERLPNPRRIYFEFWSEGIKKFSSFSTHFPAVVLFEWLAFDSRSVSPKKRKVFDIGCPPFGKWSTLSSNRAFSRSSPPDRDDDEGGNVWVADAVLFFFLDNRSKDLNQLSFGGCSLVGELFCDADLFGSAGLALGVERRLLVEMSGIWGDNEYLLLSSLFRRKETLLNSWKIWFA